MELQSSLPALLQLVITLLALVGAVNTLAVAPPAPETPTLAAAIPRRAQSKRPPAVTLQRAPDPQFSLGGVPYPLLLPSCTAQCDIWPAYSMQYYWERVAYTTTWAAGTVVLRVNRIANTTKTSTILRLPSGVTMPPTNAAGTRVKTLSWFDYVANATTTSVM
jgi:hypothetical protein